MDEEKNIVVQQELAELVRFIALHLVEKKDEVVVSTRDNSQVITIELSVGEQDMGKVIGKQGKIAKAIRKAVKAAALKNNVTTIVEII